MDEQLSTTAWRLPALRFGARMSRIRRPRRRDRWSAEEAASELHQRRGELIETLRLRSEASGIPRGAQEEIVDDAITAVAMSPRGIVNEHHLCGAFWLAVAHRCSRHREGRHLTRLGSRHRVDFDLAAQHVSADANPFETLELIDRLARAADLMAELDARERHVISVMATRGIGAASTARLLGLPLGDVRSAVRSARAKLDRVAVIYAAGRMCDFRAGALIADASGRASDREAALARAHVNACVPCRRAYRSLRREMQGREFQRAAVAAFLPVAPLPAAHVGGIGKLAIWIDQRLSFMPHGNGTRAAEVLGGAGIAKAAVAGSVIVGAGGAFTGQILHTLEHVPAHNHRAQIGRRMHRGSSTAASIQSANQTPTPSSAAIAGQAARVVVHTPKVPSKSLGYLAVGGPPSDSRGSSPSPETSGRERSAHAASVAGPSAVAGESAAPQVKRSPPPTAQSGGATNLDYLGG
jgi:DNA-directed RNA polymerase specialized sigma24 family protein